MNKHRATEKKERILQNDYKHYVQTGSSSRYEQRGQI